MPIGNNKLTELTESLFNSNPYLELLAEGNPLENPLGSSPYLDEHVCSLLTLLTLLQLSNNGRREEQALGFEVYGTQAAARMLTLSHF